MSLIVNSKQQQIVVGLAVTVLLLLTMPFLTMRSINIDETASILFAESWSGLKEAIDQGDLWMSGYYLLLYFWTRIGDSLFVVRGLSLFLGVLTIPVFHRLVRMLFSRRVAALASIIMATQVYFVTIVINARTYPLYVLLTVVQMTLFVTALRRPTWLNWTAYSVVATVIFFSHAFGVLLVPLQWLSLFFYPKKRLPNRYLVYNALFMVVAGTVILGLVWRFSNLESTSYWISPFSRNQLFNHIRIYSGGLSIFVYIIAFCLLALFEKVLFRELPQGEKFWRYILVGLWLVFPVVSVALISILYRPAFVDRYLSLVAPALILLIALGIDAIPSRILAGGVLITYVALSILGVLAWNTHDSVTYGRYGQWSHRDDRDHCENWYSTYAFFDKHYTPTDPVYIPSFFQRETLTYLASQDGREISFVEEISPATLDSLPEHRLWVFFAECSRSYRAEARALVDTWEPHYVPVLSYDMARLGIRVFELRDE